MDAKGNSNSGDGKLDQLQKELDELEKRALEEIRKNSQNKTFSVGSIPTTPQSQSVNTTPIESYSEAETLKMESVEPVTEKPTAFQATPEIHVQPNPEEPKKSIDINSKSTTKIILIIGIVMFTICLLSIGAYFLATRNTSEPVVIPTPMPIVVETPLPKLPEEENFGNTYVNSACTFKIIYPETWTVEKDNKSGFVTFESEDFDGKITLSEYKVVKGQGFGVYCQEYTGVTPETEIECEPDAAKGVSCEKFMIGNLETVNNQKNQYTAVYNGMLYTFVVFDPGDEINEILSSFKLEGAPLPTATVTPEPTPSE